MKILLVNTKLGAGGAAGIVRTLAAGYRAAGHEVHLWLGQGETTPDQTIIHPSATGGLADHLLTALLRPLDRPGRPRLAPLRARRLWQALSPRSAWAQARGHEDFHLSGFAAAEARLPWRPDLLHLHNLHGYNHLTHFDLRALPRLSALCPTVLTLHDPWLMTGHCAHPFDCDRWTTGCGACPRLQIYPKVRRDATARNWQVKAELFQRTRLHAVGVCEWVTGRARRSLLAPALASARTLANGVDTDFFQPLSPAARRARRAALGLSEDDGVIVYAAELGERNPYRDFAAMRGAVAALPPRTQGRWVAVELGGDQARRTAGPGWARWEEGFQPGSTVRDWLQVADVLLHAALADTSPTIVYEAMACALPVVGTAVCGLPEQVREGETGRLVPLGQPQALAEALAEVLLDLPRAQAWGAAARARIEAEFTQEQMVARYLALAGELVPGPR